MKIEVITNDAFQRMADLSVEAICIRAVMAYWTIPAADLPPAFLSGLKNTSGFLCVDIHNPTSLDALASIKQAGGYVLLHLVSTTGHSEIDDSSGMPNHLMHSKVIIFDYADRESVVWVGSHNGTFRALDGINFECTLAVHVDRSSDLYLEAQSHLQEIHNACLPFNPGLMAHYRYLQGGKTENSVAVIELENGNDNPLRPGDQVTVFNMSRDDLKSFKTIETDVIVSLHGSTEILYAAKVVQTGETPTSSNQAFGARRYADRKGAKLPVLMESKAVTKNMYARNTYFSVVKIDKILGSEWHLLEIPTHSPWVKIPAQDTSRFSKLDQDPVSANRHREHGAKGLKFKVPAFEEMLTPLADITYEISHAREFAFKEMRLDEKRAVARPTLIRKKVLVKR